MGTDANTRNRALEVGLTALAIAVGAVLTLVLTSGTGSSTAAPSGAAVAGNEIDIVDFEYDPPNLEVDAGTKITVVNEDTAAHTVTTDDRSVDSGTVSGGEDGSVTFKDPGTYSYFCVFHPYMKGSVEVK